MLELATGSDGLSVVSETDFGNILLPCIDDDTFKQQISLQIKEWNIGGLPISRKIAAHLKASLPKLDILPRPSHVAQV